MSITLGGGINVLAVLASGVLSMIIGFIWYGPLFGKPWSAYTGWTDEKVRAASTGGKMAMTYGLAFLAALAQAVVLTVLARNLGITAWSDGLVLGLLTGVGITALAFATTYLFDRKSVGLWAIVSGYEAVYLAASGVLVTVWR